MERCTSHASTLSFTRDICRICHCEGDDESPLFSPCFCAGSLRYVHQSCLQQWIKSSDTKSCELCKFVFIMQSKVKPINKWERLDLSDMERRKIVCSVAFHVIAITCVVWSLFVLVQRTFREEGTLEWPFWTKIVVVAIGITGSIVFMYVQCKMYFELCRRWRAFNRVIYVQDAPEKAPLNEQASRLVTTGTTLIKGTSLNNLDLEKSAVPVSVISVDERGHLHSSSVTSAAAVCGSTRSLASLAWTDESSTQKYDSKCSSKPSELENLIPRSYPWTKMNESASSPQKSTNSLNNGEGSLEKDVASDSLIDEDSDVETVHLEHK